MRLLISLLVFALFSNSLFATTGIDKYKKAMSLVSRYYYQPISVTQVSDKGMEQFLKTSQLLSDEDRKMIQTKFNYYDRTNGKKSKESIKKKLETLNEILSKKMFSQEEIFDMLIASSLESLDPHSNFLNKKKLATLKIQAKGTFGGVGLSVGIKDDKLTVVSPIYGTPAYRAGVQAGDIIYTIDGMPSESMLIDDAVALMRGKVNTSIDLTLLRRGELIPVKIVREMIRIQSVTSKKLDGGILYLRVTSFDAKVVEEVSKILKEDDGFKNGIILDLRNNPGGLLSQATGLVDLFLDEGEIVRNKTRNIRDEKVNSASALKTLTNAPLVVLINAGSASGAEIVCGALKVHKRALVLGERSFGKGNTQALLTINDEEAIKLTTAQYLFADGKSINNVGIKPDYAINTDVIDEKDIAKDAAYDYLKDQRLFNSKFFAKAYAPSKSVERFRNENIGKETSSLVSKKSYANEEIGLNTRLDKLKRASVDTTKWLIVIGIEDYEYTEDVKYSKQSAELFSKIVQKKYGVDDSHSLVLIDSDASMGRIRNKLKRLLRQVKQGDSIYFYYNGHGIPVPNQKNEPYLLPSDVEPEFASDDAFFKMKNIFKLLSDSKAKKVIAIIDSCFSGGNDGSSLIKGVAATRLVPKKVMFDKQKMVVLYAGKGVQYSNMFDRNRHRLFSYYVMDSILKGRDDVETLYNEVFINVKDESFKMGDMHLQEPTMVGNKKIKF